MEELAILGGKKALQDPFHERWQRPIEEEKAAALSLIESGGYSSKGEGPTAEFEEAFASYIGCKYALAFSHGTDALMAAYYAAGVGPGDEVITPAYGYMCSYSGALHLGARPIFCESDKESLLIDPEKVKEAITKKTRAINCIHLGGRVCDLEALMAISAEHNIPLIDDASHAHGACWQERKIGNFDHITCFSLKGCQPERGKPVCGGEGGVACTNSYDNYQKMVAYSQCMKQGIRKKLQGGKYKNLDQMALGLKWRPTAISMALALISLKGLDQRNRGRALCYSRTIDCLKKFPFIEVPKLHKEGQMGGFYPGIKFLYQPAHFGGLPRSLFMGCLQAEGVPISGPLVAALEHRRSLFTEGFDLWGNGRGPISSPWEGLEQYRPSYSGQFPISEDIYDRLCMLPSFIDIDERYYEGLELALKKMESNKDHLIKEYQLKKMRMGQ